MTHVQHSRLIPIDWIEFSTVSLGASYDPTLVQNRSENYNVLSWQNKVSMILLKLVPCVELIRPCCVDVRQWLPLLFWTTDKWACLVSSTVAALSRGSCWIVFDECLDVLHLIGISDIFLLLNCNSSWLGICYNQYKVI